MSDYNTPLREVFAPLINNGHRIKWVRRGNSEKGASNGK